MQIDFLDHWAREQPDAKFAVQGDQRLTYAEAAATVNRLARGIVQRGIEIGKRVGLLTLNRYEAVLGYLAASKIGAVTVPLHARHTQDQWLYVLRLKAPIGKSRNF